MPSIPSLAYCGPPPLPAELWSRWTFDPLLLLGIALAGAAGLWAGRRLPASRRAAFGAGWLVVALAFASPLCALAVALFGARAGQHMLLALVAAPLLALGLPRGGWQVPGSLAAAGFTALFWLWHLPGPYDAALRDGLIYWLSHLSLLGAALALWRALLREGAGPGAWALGAMASAQMGLLGAVLVFAPVPLYASHLATTLPFGLTPLQDQQLGGLLMWVPGSLAFLLAGLGGLLRLLAPASGRA
ncbi:cytochrome c oxidase assembly protein [Crenalkalicoccus roseus]|uniref:cytochrome c oxidase assembly protein n=1 Tax=Crenalkalicoccus roseus TaxID=1485588 RepID=UPI0010817032|nr:cytochrome c oxidase assembly protein [Crenalkalicoccus roseus]